MSSDVLTFSVDLRLSSGNLDPVIRMLVSGIGRIEAKAGCRNCLISRDAREENRVRYSESWASEDEFQQHVHSEEFRRILIAMDMCDEEPLVVVGNSSEQNGLSYLRQLRDQQSPSERSLTNSKK